ncbi:MAG: hypothetical protein AAB116_23935 [Candidatus Poribacteria bacterium]
MRYLTAKLIASCVSLVVVGLILTGVSNAKIDPKTCVGAWLFDDSDDYRHMNAFHFH